MTAMARSAADLNIAGLLLNKVLRRAAEQC